MSKYYLSDLEIWKMHIQHITLQQLELERYMLVILFSTNAVVMSENIMMWKIAHFFRTLCAIFAISLRISYFLTTENVSNAKIAHLAWKICAFLKFNV